MQSMCTNVSNNYHTNHSSAAMDRINSLWQSDQGAGNTLQMFPFLIGVDSYMQLYFQYNALIPDYLHTIANNYLFTVDIYVRKIRW